MTITERRHKNATVLDLDGIFANPGDAELLDATVRRVCRAERPWLVLNMANVPWIDAAGLGALIAAYHVARRNGGTLRLARAARRVYALLIMCRLTTVIETFDSVEAALADCLASDAEAAMVGSHASHLSSTSLDVIQGFLQRA
jgi:anti-sigma B factor antagonist